MEAKITMKELSERLKKAAADFDRSVKALDRSVKEFNGAIENLKNIDQPKMKTP